MTNVDEIKTAIEQRFEAIAAKPEEELGVNHAGMVRALSSNAENKELALQRAADSMNRTNPARAIEAMQDMGEREFLSLLLRGLPTPKRPVNER